MAYTSVIPVRRLDRAVKYVMNKEKTTAVSLQDALDYAANRDKTEQSCFESSYACTLETAFADMRQTKEQWHKSGGVQGYHLVQSFAAGEVTPELAHQIAKELADRVLGGQYEYVIGTHLNTGHMHCGCCGARLYWHPKSNQWFCRECGMWSKPTQAEETFNSIVEKLRWLQQNPELIHPPAGKANVQSMEIVLLDREIEQALLDEEPDADALITKILHRAELEYEFCSAGDADPATMQIQKACAEYAPTEEFPETFYKEVVSKVILYRDTHIEFKLQNGQIV